MAENDKNTIQGPHPTEEQIIRAVSGWAMLSSVIVIFLLAIGSMVLFVLSGVEPNFWYLGGFILPLLTGIFLCCGFFTLQPNQASVLILFGHYRGTVRDEGFHWTNPFNSKRRVSLRSRNFNSEPLKVNDKRGNPIEIGAVVVWKVRNSAQAIFDVEDYEEFVEVQSESALRHLANSYAYDNGEEGEATLRSDVDEVSLSLLQELQERLAQAGVVVEEARLSHLAYAPEIASAMLRRQQARGDHHRPHQDCPRRRQHGRDGAEGLGPKPNRRTGRGAEGGHGQQPAGGAVQ